MRDKMCGGTMLIEDGAHTPESVGLVTESYSAGWSSITRCSSAELGKEIEKAGWTFFYMAGEIHTLGFGFNDQSRTDRAVAHALKIIKRENCNCLEIDQIRQRSFLGLRYASLVAHARHIQISRNFHDVSNMPPKAAFTGESVHAWENEGGSPAEKRPSTRSWPAGWRVENNHNERAVQPASLGHSD
jgi:hypothetical protein